jgi:ankyrin repeat protein
MPRTAGKEIIVTRHSLPTRALSADPDLDQLKRQAKELRDAFRAGNLGAHAEVTAHYHGASTSTFGLHDAQLVIARAYGFESWPKLKAYVDGATCERFTAAVRARDLPQLRAMLQARPELAVRSGALHTAVVDRVPELVRLLMEHGANARAGIYPHRDATSAVTIADERGYDDITAIIQEEERRRQQRKSRVGAPSDELFDAIRSGDDARAVTLMESDPALIGVRHPVFDWTPLILSAQMLNSQLVAWLLDHGADAGQRAMVHPFEDLEQRARADAGHTALDAAASSSGAGVETKDAGRFASVSRLLLERGAELTPRAAVALGNAEWLRARHAEGTLTNPIEESGGLLRIAVSHNRPEILHLLLQFGFDPDERVRFRDAGGDEVVFTWGMPLWQCAASGRHEMASLLLARGADPNAEVYASGTPLNQAYGRRDKAMIDLLERHGGTLDAEAVGLYRLTDRARQIMTGATANPTGEDDVPTVAEHLLMGAACGGDPEAVRLALERIDWRRDDPRWFSILEQPLRIWNHGTRFWSNEEWDRGTYLTCFGMVLERCDPNLRGRVDDGRPLGLTILHAIAGSREHVTLVERVAFATMLLDAGARLDLRDDVLRSTPLGWACRWGRMELVTLYLERGADPVESDAEPWATPLAWARKKGHFEIEAALLAAATA